MNILFVLKTLSIGGVEVVTAYLADKFVAEGYNVHIFSFEEGDGALRSHLSKDVKLNVGTGFYSNDSNVGIVRKLLIENEIETIINQWGLPLVPIKIIEKAKKDLDIKIISIFHNDPLQNGRIQEVKTQIKKTTNSVKKTYLWAKYFLYRCITGYAMRYNYQHSDVFEVLSPSFVSHFQKFTWLKNTPRLVVQTNPITIDFDGFEYSSASKLKEIIYVGRVDYTQKRVYRVIETWAQLECDFPEWKLTIVGDGEERKNIEHMVSEMELRNVNFEGFQSPRPYYERASILMLTSEFEGFPLVLAECMSFGVVPVVYGCYSAVYDIIEDGKDGLIIPKADKGFDTSDMAERMRPLMTDSEELKKMAHRAIIKSKDYSIDIIYQQWMKVLQDINI